MFFDSHRFAASCFVAHIHRFMSNKINYCTRVSDKLANDPMALAISQVHGVRA